MRWNRNHLRTLLRLIAGLSAATVFGQYASCRESVTAAYYTGLENLAVGLVQAFFEAITPTSSSTDTTTASLILNSIHGLLT